MFLDTLNTPTYRKKLRRLSSQDPGDSRRRWEHVTRALRKKDVEAATDAKHAVSSTHITLSHTHCQTFNCCLLFVQLEEIQRAGAKDRKEKGTKWQQQMFHLEGETWTYNTPLDKRKPLVNADSR